jgi:hypothetical protein
MGKQHPKQPISMAKVGTLDCAPERRQLLTKRQVLKRHGTVSSAEERQGSKTYDNARQH